MERDPLAKRNGYTAQSYCDTLEEGLLPQYLPGQIFMQDNTPIHKAILMREFLMDHGIYTMDWPPYSPDLNPIEHL
jgi:transposase